MTTTTPDTHSRIGQFVLRNGRHGYRTGQWAQILNRFRSHDRDCWLVIYQDGEPDVIPIGSSQTYVFRSAPTDWRF